MGFRIVYFVYSILYDSNSFVQQKTSVYLISILRRQWNSKVKPNYYYYFVDNTSCGTIFTTEQTLNGLLCIAL